MFDNDAIRLSEFARSLVERSRAAINPSEGGTQTGGAEMGLSVEALHLRLLTQKNEGAALKALIAAEIDVLIATSDRLETDIGTLQGNMQALRRDCQAMELQMARSKIEFTDFADAFVARLVGQFDERLKAMDQVRGDRVVFKLEGKAA